MYYVFSDVHGCIEQMEKALRQWNPDKEQLVIVGDLIDRGPNPLQCVRLAKKLAEEYGAFILKGNHEEMFLDWLENEKLADIFLYSDAVKTIESFFLDEHTLFLDYKMSDIVKKIKEDFSEELIFLKGLPEFYETENILFIHAGIDLDRENWKEGGSDDFLWIREQFIFSEKEFPKKIVFGHTPTRFINKDKSDNIWVSPGETKIGIDGACVFGGQLNVVTLNEQGEMLSKYKFR